MHKKEPIWTKGFISLFFTNLSVFIVFYGLISALPLLAVGELGKSDDDAGLLMTIFLLSAIFVRPFSGKLLDVFGKRRMLWISLAFYLFCTVLYYFIHIFEALLVLRFFHGIWFSIATTAGGALAADNVPVKRRGAGLGYYTMSTNLAVVVGPFIALTVIQAFSFEVLFIILSVLITIGALTALLIPERAKPQPEQKPKFKLTIGDLFEKNAMPVALLAGLFAFSYASVLSFLSIFAQERGVLAFASAFFFMFAAVMLLTRPFTGRIFDEKGPKFIMIPGLLLFIVGLLLLSITNSAWVFLLAGAFIGLGYGAVVPSLQTVAIQSTTHERSGYATATYFTMFDLGIAIGSYVLGFVAVYAGYQAVYLVSAALVLIVWFVYIAMTKKKPHEPARQSAELEVKS